MCLRFISSWRLSFFHAFFLSVGQGGVVRQQGSRWGPPGLLPPFCCGRKPRLFRCLVPPDAAPHWMGTVWSWWADLRGISGLLWWIGKNSGRLSTHSCVFVCFIMLWPLACLWLWLQPWTTFPSHWPHSSGAVGLQTAGTPKFLERHESFQRNMILPQGLWERSTQTGALYHLKVSFLMAAFVWDLYSFTNISSIHEQTISECNFLGERYKPLLY